MLNIRFLIVFFITSLASSASYAQTPLVNSAVDVSVQSADNEIVSVLSGAIQSSDPVQPEVASPAPAIPESVTTSQPEILSPSPSVAVSNNRNQTKIPVYSPRRDGLPTIEQRRQLRAMPIEQRPYRPFHFYGNTVRRRLAR